MKVLIINSGSSSIKFQLLKMPEAEVLASGQVDRIGIEGGKITYKTKSDSLKEKVDFENHEQGLKRISKLLMDAEIGVISKPDEVDAVGHRVVHGGNEFTETVLISEEVKKNINKLSSLAPLHNPHNLKGIEVAERIFKGVPQVAVFDTAYHQTLPKKAYQYAIPQKFLKEEYIRVYGFHGTSHKYVAKKAIDFLNKSKTKIITIHLGNGCSMSAVEDGVSIDTSLGFGPASGLIMGTRSGDIDHSVIFYMIREMGNSAEEVNDILNKKSGMLGLTGHSDLRDIEEAASKGDRDSQMALEMNAYRIKKYIGAYAAILNGLDAIVFTAGIGENSSLLRKKICSDMDYLGLFIDDDRNKEKSVELRSINAPNSEIAVLVIPTNEELEIASQVVDLLNDQ